MSLINSRLAALLMATALVCAWRQSPLLAQDAIFHAAVFVVTNTADSGDGSLRQAILFANDHPGLDEIQFAIPGPGPQRIAVLTPLPHITDPVYLHGSSQPGSDCSQWPPTLMVRLDGQDRPEAGSGLMVYASNSTIEGLVISRFAFTALSIIANHVTVQCNFFGTDPTGTQNLGNGSTAIWIWGASSGQGDHNIIGVDSSGQGVGNLIAGNGASAIDISNQYASDNLVAGNFIGVDVSGMQSFPNGSAGVSLRYGPHHNQIGGPLPAMRNVIAASAPGIALDQAPNTQILGNYIGVNAAGSASLPNMYYGINVGAVSPDVTIAGNLVSGNKGIGLFLAGGPRPIVQGNIIGADSSGLLPLGNSDHGIYAIITWDGLFGGVDPGQANLIAYNGGNGILVSDTEGRNHITANRIFGNALLGIDLGYLSPTGVVTPNDPGDADSGFNEYQNFPVIDHAFAVGDAALYVDGLLNSVPNQSYHLEFFASRECDSSGYGEGERYLGGLDVTTGADGNAPFTTVLLANVPEGEAFTATATNAAGSTSEFSACRRAAAAPPSMAGLPIPLADRAETAEDTPITIDVLANDLDPDGGALTVVNVSTPLSGATRIEGNRVVFSPAANLSGRTQFLYGISDGNPNHTVVQASVQVRVTPVNDAPSEIVLSPSAIGENLPAGTVVGDLSAADADAGDSHIFFLADGGPDNALFRLNGRQLLANASFDFETRSSYSVAVRVEDRADAALQKQIAITVGNTNDAPTSISLSNSKVDENQPANTVVGAFSSSDPDVGDTHTYQLASGAGSDDNALFSVSGATLRTAGTLDYEARRQHTVRVRSTDNKGAGFERAFVIAVGDQLSPPDPPSNSMSLCSGAALTLIDANAGDVKTRVLVRVDDVVISELTATSCTVAGVMTVIANGNSASSLAFSGKVNPRNEFTSSTIADFDLQIAGLTFQVRSASVQFYNGRAQIAVAKPWLKIPDEWGGLGTPLNVPTIIDSGGLRIGPGVFNLPSIDTKSGYRLALTGTLALVDGDFVITADGELTVPNIGKSTGKPGQTCGLSAGVTISVGTLGETVMEITAAGGIDSVVETTLPHAALAPEAMRLERITVGFHCSQGIPIASTGLLLTAVKGTVILNATEESVTVEVSIISAQKIAGGTPVATMDGVMRVQIEPRFQLDLGVTLQLVALGIVKADATVTETSFHTTVSIDASFIRGSASITAWSTDNNLRWHFTGSANVELFLEAGKLGELCVPLPCAQKWCKGDWFSFGQPYPCEWGLCDQCTIVPPSNVGPLLGSSVQVGEFSNGRYGIKGYFQLLGATFGFFVDEDGKPVFGDLDKYVLASPSSVAAAFASWRQAQSAAMTVNAAAFAPYTFVPNAADDFDTLLIAAPLDKGRQSAAVQAADTITQVNLLKNVDVTFVLESGGPLGFSLIAPDGFEITPANYQSNPAYHVEYEQVEHFVLESSAAERDPEMARLRFTHAAPESGYSPVDLRVGGALLFGGVDFHTPTATGYLALAPGTHTIDVVPAGGGAVLESTVATLAAGSDYSALLLGYSAAGAAPELLVTPDNGAPPSAAGVSRVRLVNGSALPVTLIVDGAPLFANRAYASVSDYIEISAGSHDIDLRDGANQVVAVAQSYDFDEGDLYTIFTADDLDGGHTVLRLQRSDAAYRRQIRSTYTVDQATVGLWQVKLTGDVTQAQPLVTLFRPTNPPVLGGLTVDASNLHAVAVNWRLTADYTPVKLSLFITPGPITRTLAITGEAGVTFTTVPAFEGFAVAEFLLSAPAELNGSPASRVIDLSALESGDYYLWLRADDGINPPVTGYAALPTLAAAGVDNGYGVQAVRVAQDGYEPLAQLAGAAKIHVDHSTDFPTTWDAAIRTSLDAATGDLYVEWNALPHPDVETYALVIEVPALGSRQTISAGGAVPLYDANGSPVGAPIGYVLFADVEPGQSYKFSVLATDADRKRTAQSLAATYAAPVGDYRLSAASEIFGVEAGKSLQIPVQLSILQPLFYPAVGLALDLSGAPPGLEAGFVGGAETAPVLSVLKPTVTVRVAVDEHVADGLYPLHVIGRNGAQERRLTVWILVGELKLYLPVITSK